MNPSATNRRVLVVALDGADWNLIDPLLALGDLPNLASILGRDDAYRAILESTTPPVTFPAWTTFLTGVNPGRHGVLDFARWLPGTYEVRFTGGGQARRVPTILEHLAAAGKRVASLGVPGTWPPMDLPGGFVLSGFDAPVAIGPGPDFARPKETYRRVAEEHGPWVFADVDELKVGTGWHQRAGRRLLEGLERKGRIAGALMATKPWDLFVVHIGETDTAGHHFYAHHDRASPRRDDGIPEAECETLAEVYRAADRVIGGLVKQAGDEVALLIASDHGMEGASDRVFHPNRALHQAGFLCFRETGITAGFAGRVEPLARQAALRLLPARLKEALVRRLRGPAGMVESRRRLEGVDLAKTLAFSEELTYAPSVRLNIRGREPLGLIAPEEVDAVRAQLSSYLLALRDPTDGAPMVELVQRREDVFVGPASDEAPDLVFVPAAVDGYRYTVLPSSGAAGAFFGRLRGEARLGGKGRGPTGVHRRDGVLVIAGAGRSVSLDAAGAALCRVPIGACAPTLMSLCGVAPPPGLDWESLIGDAGAPAEDPAPALETPAGYTPSQEAVVADRLRSLGYLD